MKEQITDIPMTWMNFKDVMLSEGSQTHKATNCAISFICHSGKNKTLGTESTSVVASWGESREQMTRRMWDLEAEVRTVLHLDYGAG